MTLFAPTCSPLNSLHRQREVAVRAAVFACAAAQLGVHERAIPLYRLNIYMYILWCMSQRLFLPRMHVAHLRDLR